MAWRSGVVMFFAKGFLLYVNELKDAQIMLPLFHNS